jgi:hypothetical protein
MNSIAAARLMGADCIISGIRPQIGQTIVQLGLQLNVVSKATLADALAWHSRGSGKPSRRPSADRSACEGSDARMGSGRLAARQRGVVCSSERILAGPPQRRRPQLSVCLSLQNCRRATFEPCRNYSALTSTR